MWNKEWINHRGSVEVICAKGEVHRGFMFKGEVAGDHPIAFVQCDDGQERQIHPRHVRPLQVGEFR